MILNSYPIRCILRALNSVWTLFCKPLSSNGSNYIPQKGNTGQKQNKSQDGPKQPTLVSLSLRTDI